MPEGLFSEGSWHVPQWACRLFRGRALCRYRYLSPGTETQHQENLKIEMICVLQGYQELPVSWIQERRSAEA